MAEGKEELKNPLMNVKEESENVILKNSTFRKLRSGSITSWQIDGEAMETVRVCILGAPKSLQMVTAAMKLKAPWKKSYDQPRQPIKKQRHYFANKGLLSQSNGFSSGHVWM